MAKSKKPQEAVNSSYAALPHNVLDSVALMGASHTARSLLFDIVRQHNGRNNGRMQLYAPWLRKRGWASCATIQKAKKELVQRGLIVQTRQGGLNAGPNYYGLTWLPISNFVGLDIGAKDYHPGAWAFLNNLSIGKKRVCSSGNWNGAVPANGTDALLAVPGNGTKRVLYRAIAVPDNGNNVCLPLPTYKLAKRIVGKKRVSPTP